MKILVIAIITMMGLSTHLMGQELSFQYDNAGNQIVREWICVNCPRVNSTDPIGEQQAGVPTKNRLEKAMPEDLEATHKLSVYPNPLTEVLNVKWSNTDSVTVKTMDVFSLNGIRLFHQDYAENQREAAISFLNLPAGSYLLKVLYSNGKQEVVKLIKQ